MLRKIYLSGELGARFGTEFSMAATTYTEVLKCIEANRPGFKNYLMECYDDGIGFCFDTAGKGIEKEEDLLIPLKEGDITISAIPSGSKGIGKIIIAIAIIYAMSYGYVPPEAAVAADAGAAAGTAAAAGTPAVAGTGNWAINAAGALTKRGMAAAMVASNFATMGLAEIMAQDPSIDNKETNDYLFKGQAENTAEGDPVPLIYGEMITPGRPITTNIINGFYSDPTNYFLGDGIGITNNIKSDTETR